MKIAITTLIAGILFVIAGAFLKIIAWGESATYLITLGLLLELVGICLLLFRVITHKKLSQ